MAYFLEQLINGITLGSIYGLIAIGYTMVYGIIGMINFAHGEIYMIGAFCALTGFLLCKLVAITFIPLVLILVLLFTILITSAYGWSIEKVAYKPLRQSQRLAPLITAIGMSIALQNYVQVTQGARPKTLQPIIDGGIQFSVQEGGQIIYVSFLKIFIIVLTVLLMLLLSFLINKTSLGRKQRACQQDQKMSALLGINVDKTISITFIIGSVLAAVAGYIVVLFYGVVDFYIGFLAGIKAFTAAVLGGIGSIAGAMLGGLVIGLVEALWSAYFSIEYKDVASFSILILVLIFRPSGILGKPEIEKV